MPFLRAVRRWFGFQKFSLLRGRWAGSLAGVVAVGLGGMLLGACAVPNRYDQLQTLAAPAPLGAAVSAVSAMSPVPTAAAASTAPGPVVGVAFGGGGVRGFMHLGVIRALQEAGIRAQVVTGSSAGAVAAALYATGMPLSELEALAQGVREKDVADLVLSTQGVVQGQALARWVNQSVGQRRIEDMPIKLGVTVTDLSAGQARLVVQGDVGQAVQASASIPGTVVPVLHGDAVWVDGGVLSLVPVRFARQLGAQWVLGVDVYCGKTPQLRANALNVAYNTFRVQTCKLSEAEVAEADVLIRPSFDATEFRSFAQRDAAIEAGYQATRAALPEIRKRLQRDTLTASADTGPNTSVNTSAQENGAKAPSAKENGAKAPSTKENGAKAP